MVKLGDQEEAGMQKLGEDVSSVGRWVKKTYRRKHPKKRPDYIPYKKKIDGKMYTYHSRHILESRAKSQASFVKQRGNYVRILEINGDIVVYKRGK